MCVRKKCPKCRQFKNSCKFDEDSSEHDGFSVYCRKCCEDQYSSRKQHKKDVYLKRVYNLSLEQYNILKEVQNNKCAICGTHENEITKGLYTDHCHTTGRVRGLLCCSCNTALGLFKDNVEFMRKAIEYLK